MWWKCVLIILALYVLWFARPIWLDMGYKFWRTTFYDGKCAHPGFARTVRCRTEVRTYYICTICMTGWHENDLFAFLP